MKVGYAKTQSLVGLKPAIGRVNIDAWWLKWEFFSKDQGSVEVASIKWRIFGPFYHVVPL